MATICALAVVLAGVAAYGWHVGWFAKSTSNGNTTTPQTSQTSALPRADVPSPKKNEPAAQAQRAGTVSDGAVACRFRSLLVGFNNHR